MTDGPVLPAGWAWETDAVGHPLATREGDCVVIRAIHNCNTGYELYRHEHDALAGTWAYLDTAASERHARQLIAYYTRTTDP